MPPISAWDWYPWPLSLLQPLRRRFYSMLPQDWYPWRLSLLQYLGRCFYRMLPQDRIPQDVRPPQDGIPQTTRIRPPFPVKNSVLRQLGIAENELPHGLARLKYNLLLSPLQPPSQESNVCTNSVLFSIHDVWTRQLQKSLYDTIAESSIAHRGPDPDIEDFDSKKKTFQSMSYLDQIAIVCLASGLYACQAPDCLQYRRKLERVVPVCHSWPGLRDWVLCITSCSLRTISEIQSWDTRFEPGNGNALVLKEGRGCNYGLGVCRRLSSTGPPERCWIHLTACILLTAPLEAVSDRDWQACNLTRDWDPTEISESGILEETAYEGGSIGGPRPDQTIYFFERTPVSPSHYPRFTPKFLTYHRHANLRHANLRHANPALALHQCLGLTFICKHLILYKKEALQVHQLMLLRFSS